MAVYVSFNLEHIPFASQVLFHSPVRYDKLWLNTVYRDILYKSKGLEEDLFNIVKNRHNQTIVEGIILDDLKYILDNFIFEGDKVFKKRVISEFALMSCFVTDLVNKYPFYNSNGILLFQSIDFIDPTTIGFFKITQKHIEGV
jgi:hypothetical protein